MCIGTDEDCDIKIAVNLRGNRSTSKNKVPNAVEAVFHSYEIMMEATTLAKLSVNPVDMHIRPPILDVDVMDFHRAAEAYQQGLEIKQNFKERLREKLCEPVR